LLELGRLGRTLGAAVELIGTLHKQGVHGVGFAPHGATP